MWSVEILIFTCLIVSQERYMREYQRRLSVFESVPGTGSIVSISVGIVDRMQLNPIVWCDCQLLK